MGADPRETSPAEASDKMTVEAFEAQRDSVLVDFEDALSGLRQTAAQIERRAAQTDERTTRTERLVNKLVTAHLDSRYRSVTDRLEDLQDHISPEVEADAQEEEVGENAVGLDADDPSEQPTAPHTADGTGEEDSARDERKPQPTAELSVVSANNQGPRNHRKLAIGVTAASLLLLSSTTAVIRCNAEDTPEATHTKPRPSIAERLDDGPFPPFAEFVKKSGKEGRSEDGHEKGSSKERTGPTEDQQDRRTEPVSVNGNGSSTHSTETRSPATAPGASTSPNRQQTARQNDTPAAAPDAQTAPRSKPAPPQSTGPSLYTIPDPSKAAYGVNSKGTSAGGAEVVSTGGASPPR